MGGHLRDSERQQRGFTLFELLVSIAVILAISAICYGSYTQAIDRANKARCTGNVRSIVAGALMFANDRDGKLWTRTEVGYSKYRMLDDPLGLPELLKEYVPNKRVWLCPAGRKSLTKFGNNYSWNATVSFETDNINTFKSPALVVYDTYAFSLPSMYNASDDFKGDGTSTTGPTSLNSKFHIRPHLNKTAANWGRSDGSVVTGYTAAQ